MEFMDAVRFRRTVRKFKPDPIPDEIIKEILEAGRLAATGGYADRWRFGVITDDAQKRDLAAAAGGQDWIADAPVVLALCTTIQTDLKDAGEDDIMLKVRRARFGDDLVAYLNAYPDRRAMQVLGQDADCLIPGQQMFLAAAGHGLRGCWIGFLDIERASKLLNLPTDVICLFLMPLGYPDEEPEAHERKPLGEMVFRDRFGA
jgi:nitroreductase